MSSVVSKILANWDVPKDEQVRVPIENYPVGVFSLRLKTFARAYKKNEGKICCVACGLPAKFFAVENFARGHQPYAHVNLYGLKDGEEVLFTHDHTLARALGGADNLSNTTVMCSPCNSMKSVVEQKRVMAKRKNGKTDKRREGSTVGETTC